MRLPVDAAMVSCRDEVWNVGDGEGKSVEGLEGGKWHDWHYIMGHNKLQMPRI